MLGHVLAIFSLFCLMGPKISWIDWQDLSPPPSSAGEPGG